MESTSCKPCDGRQKEGSNYDNLYEILYATLEKHLFERTKSPYHFINKAYIEATKIL